MNLLIEKASNKYEVNKNHYKNTILTTINTIVVLTREEFQN